MRYSIIWAINKAKYLLAFTRWNILDSDPQEPVA